MPTRGIFIRFAPNLNLKFPNTFLKFQPDWGARLRVTAILFRVQKDEE